MSAFDALGILANQLLQKACETTRLTSGAKLRAGNLKPHESGDVVSKIFIPRVKSDSTKFSAKHRLVGMASMQRLRSCVREVRRRPLSRFSVEDCGVWATIVGEGRDMLSVQLRAHQFLGFDDDDDDDHDDDDDDDDESCRVVLL